MTTFSKVLIFLILGAIFLAAITHPAGFAGNMVAGGSVLDNTLRIESGQGPTGATGGQTGTINLGGGQSVMFG